MRKWWPRLLRCTAEKLDARLVLEEYMRVLL